ncbi:MAG: LiaF transmembrane domain-containing protein [Chitinophagaceae bacterium]
MQREEFRTRMEEKRMRWQQQCEKRSRNSHIWTGAFILLVGISALVKASVTDLPDWMFSWQTFLILLGLFIGFKHNFRGPAWMIMILVGSAFLVRDLYPELPIRRYIWPVVLILIGAFIILRPRRRFGITEAGAANPKPGSGEGTTILDEEESWSHDDYIDTTSFFGGDKKNILSKDFKGGEVVNIFGGIELNLSQADIRGRVNLEITTIFGGTKLIIPSNWEVKSEAVTIFGGMEDKRNLPVVTQNPDKVLVLTGTVLFGGIEIKSY